MKCRWGDAVQEGVVEVEVPQSGMASVVVNERV